MFTRRLLVGAVTVLAAVGAGVTRVSLDHQVPIANAILTVENEAQAQARVEDKSREAARVAVEMANLMDELL